MFILGGILGAAGGLISGAAQARQQRRNIRSQLAADRELAEYQYGKDLEMWHRQNLYNSPSQQMARLREAGLNPRLVYGSQTVTGNTSAQMPRFQSVKSDFSSRRPAIDPLNILSAFQNIKGKSAQIQGQELQNENQKIQNLHADNILRAKFGSSWEDVERKVFERGLRTGEGIYVSPEGREIVFSKTPGFKKYHSEIAKTQAQTKGYIVGEQLKQIEKEWLEMMKKAGITKALGLPLLKMVIGR